MRTPRTTTLPVQHARTGAWIATVFLTGSSLLSFWIAFTGQRVSGGLPWLPDAMNQRLGHVLFAFSGVICACLAMLAFRDATRPVDSRKRSAA